MVQEVEEEDAIGNDGIDGTSEEVDDDAKKSGGFDGEVDEEENVTRSGGFDGINEATKGWLMKTQG